jgi:hypothetical protein
MVRSTIDCIDVETRELPGHAGDIASFRIR